MQHLHIRIHQEEHRPKVQVVVLEFQQEVQKEIKRTISMTWPETYTIGRLRAVALTTVVYAVATTAVRVLTTQYVAVAATIRSAVATSTGSGCTLLSNRTFGSKGKASYLPEKLYADGDTLMDLSLPFRVINCPYEMTIKEYPRLK